MGTPDDAPIVQAALRATQRAADVAAVQTALDELHALVFGDGASHSAGDGELRRCLSNARALLDTTDTATRSDLYTVQLLIEAMVTLGEMLVGVAEGRRTRSRTVTRLEDVVLPILFLRSSITAQLLRAHALKLPWMVFQNACRVSRKESDKLAHTFASWKAHHEWDFTIREVRCHAPNAEPTVAPLPATASVGRKEAERAPNAPERQRTMLRDISWNASLKRSAGIGIPSYLLSKRRPSDVYPQREGGSSLPPGASGTTGAPLPPHKMHTFIDNVDESSGAKVLALKSPVKRRRIDFHMGVPPSPDRPGRCP